LELKYKLSHKDGELRFTSQSVAKEEEGVEELLSILEKNNVPRKNVWIVISSGTGQVAKSESEACMENLKVDLSKRIGLPVQEIRPDQEAGYLLLELIRL